MHLKMSFYSLNRSLTATSHPYGTDKVAPGLLIHAGHEIYREKIVLATMPELRLQIVEFAREHGRITIGEAIKK